MGAHKYSIELVIGIADDDQRARFVAGSKAATRSQPASLDRLSRDDAANAINAAAAYVLESGAIVHFERMAPQLHRDGNWEAFWPKLRFDCDLVAGVRAVMRTELAGVAEARTSLLLIAATRGSVDSIEALLADGTGVVACAPGRPESETGAVLLADTPFRDFDGAALRAAAGRGHAMCVARLLPVSDAWATNSAGQTALELAIECDAAEVADLLAPHSPRPQAEAAYQLFGPERMPGWAPFLAAEERAVLRAEIRTVSTAATASIDPDRNGPDARGSSRAPRRGSARRL